MTVFLIEYKMVLHKNIHFTAFEADFACNLYKIKKMYSFGEILMLLYITELELMCTNICEKGLVK